MQYHMHRPEILDNQQGDSTSSFPFAGFPDIDLNNVKEGYTPLYDSPTVKKTIINKESLKKWNCE